jgi:phenylalanyl-tRNA synthetase alpha chain
MKSVEEVKELLLAQVASSDSPQDVLKSVEFRNLYSVIATLPPNERAAYGNKVNDMKRAVELAVANRQNELEESSVTPIDVSAPMADSQTLPELLSTELGTVHPLSKELETVIDIYTRMGFEALESRQIDDDEHMFATLNFPANHPARDGYDTFRTEEGFIPPAHTSTMQNRILKSGRAKLERDGMIACVSYGRVYRNEDVDATHEHTFYQCEGIFVSRDASLAQMIGTLTNFFETYYGQHLRIKTQPGYFPFVEPGLEFLIERPQSLKKKKSAGEEWLEMLGCGMIHPNVLLAAGIDPNEYKGFAWGGGIDRLVMLKYGIDDVRHFEAGQLTFLRKFK